MDTRGSLLPLRYFLLREGLVWELTQSPDSASRLQGLLGAFNVKYVIGNPDLRLPGWDEIFASPAAKVWKNPQVRPRMYLVGRVQKEELSVVPERRPHAVERVTNYRDTVVDWRSREADAQIVDRVLADDFDYRTSAIVDASMIPSLSGAEPKYELEDLSVPDDADAIRFRVRTDIPALLVTGNSFSRGWTATVNGVAAPIVRTNWLLQGVVVAAGESDVRLVYEAPGFRMGLIATMVTGLFVTGAVVLSRQRRARPRRY